MGNLDFAQRSGDNKATLHKLWVEVGKQVACNDGAISIISPTRNASPDLAEHGQLEVIYQSDCLHRGEVPSRYTDSFIIPRQAQRTLMKDCVPFKSQF